MPDLRTAAVAAAFTLGMVGAWNDATGSIGTAVSTRSMPPQTALFLAAAGNLAGAFYSLKVAETVGRGIVDPAGMSPPAVLAAVLAALAWTAAMAALGLSVSASHALIGGLVGAAFAQGGWAVLDTGGIRLILGALLLYPLLGGVLGYLLMQGITRAAANGTPHGVGRFFRRAQVFSVALYGFGHGTADAQKVMGVLALALAAGQTSGFSVPGWVRLISGLVVALGTLAGGWAAIRRRRLRALRLHPSHGFAGEVGAGLLLILAGATGLPVSTTQTLAGTLLGVGAATRVARVRWVLADRVVATWVATLPASALGAFLLHRLLGLLL